MRNLLAIATVLLFIRCVKPFDFEVRKAENVLVVEATISNELKKQRVVLSRASNLEDIISFANEYFVGLPFRPVEDTIVNPERGAVVTISNDDGNLFSFTEIEAGIYQSDIAFAAQVGVNYQLNIISAINEIYQSEIEQATGSSQLDNIYAERTTNATGDDGIAIYVDGSDATGTSNYFRYTYEETYKIVAPRWHPREYEIVRDDLVFLDDGTILYPAVNLIERSEEQQVCYKTVASANINLKNTTVLEKPIVSRNNVRFIDRNNHILSHRYSILVKQFLQSIDSYFYYENLNNFTKSESVFSEIQPGFLEGNIKAMDTDEPVVGYFDVSSVSEKRLFFNYVDFFSGEDLPPGYFFGVNCERLISPQIGDPELDGPPPPPPGACPRPLLPQIKLGLIAHVAVNSEPDICEGPFWVTPSICGDCTVIGSNVIPDFWEE